MKFKRFNILAVLLILIFVLSSCGEAPEPAEPKFNGDKIEKEASGDIEGVHLRDKKMLYENEVPTEVVTMYLTVSTGNSGENTDHTWEEINTYSVYDYDRMGVDRYKVEGLLQVGDENGVLAGELGYNQVSPNCTIQIRGQSSSTMSQKNYKISIKENKGQWRGQSTIALNKHQGDSLRFRNKLVYDLITGVDELVGLRTTFVHLYVKDTTAGGDGKFHDYGLYTQVEQLNKTALKTHGLDRNGHLYKVNFFEFYRDEDVIKLKDDPTYDIKAFEEKIEIKGSDDHSKLIKMLDRLNDYSIPIEKVLEESFDVENLTYWLAFNILIGNVDTQSRNFYLYSPLASNKWYFIPWDNDAAFRRDEYKLRGRVDYVEWETGVSNYWGNVLFQRCLKSEMFREELDKAILKLKGYLSKERINSMANMYAGVVKPYLNRMPDVMYAPLSPGQYDFVLGKIADEVESNYKLYKESFEKPMPFFINIPRVEGNTLFLEWETSYDFDIEPVTYTVELARDPGFTNVILKEEDVVFPSVKTELPPNGQYFVRVKAKNKSGKSQYAFDYYFTEGGKIYGTKCFYVKPGGKITEDVYVEG